MNKPFAESCVQNQADIYAELKTLLADKTQLLEIGSGTGQHAVYFAERLPHLVWHTSDQSDYHEGINLWLNEANLANTRPPIALNVSKDIWPDMEVDALFSANAVHIMSWSNVEDYFQQAPKRLIEGGVFILYGPFNYNGQFTSESNARFDQWLKQSNPASGVRDFEALDKLAQASNMTLEADIAMPANNRLLCWKKTH